MEDNPLRTLCMYLVMAFMAAALIDCAGGDSLVREGQVIDQAFKPAETGWTTDSNGDLKTVWTPESYTIVVRTATGIVKVDTDANGYYSVKAGQHINYRVRHGWLSNYDWNPEL